MDRLWRLSDAILESGWLLAVSLVPLCFQVSSSEAFEPAKAGLLRALALVILAAWGSRSLASGERPTVVGLRALLRLPLAGPVSLLVAVTALSAGFSILPRDSLWGYRPRSIGLITPLAWIAIFAAMAANLRSHSQIDRLVRALLLPSLPIGLCALFERAGYEPLVVVFRETEVQRAVSTLGQPVFLGAYFAMLVPFATMRAWDALRGPGERSRLRAFAWAALAAFQALVVVATESRGPLAGLIAGVAVAFLALAARNGWRRSVLVLAAVGLVFVAGLKTLPLLARGPDAPTLVRRYGAMLDSKGTSAQYRAVNWQIAARVFAHSQPLTTLDGHADRSVAMRKLLGHGPDTQQAISQPFYPREVNDITSTLFLSDRYHNDFWDALVTTGIAGLLATVLVQATTLFLALRVLGLAACRRRKVVYWALWLGGGALGAGGAVLAFGGVYAFLGAQIGSLLGIGGFLAGSAFQRTVEDAKSAKNAPQAPLASLGIAALGAIVAHLVEIGFSFTVVSTGLLFWISLALLFFCDHAQTELTLSAHKKQAAPYEWLVDAGIAGAILATLGYDYARDGATLGAAVFASLTHVTSSTGRWGVPVVACLIVSTLVACVVFASPRSRSVRIAGLAAVVGAVGWILVDRPLARGLVEVTQRIDARQESVTGYFLCLTIVLALVAAGLAQPGPARRGSRSTWRTTFAAMLGALAIACVYATTLRPAWAEVSAGLAQGYRSQARLPQALQAASRAVHESPHEEAFRVLLAKVRTSVASAAAGPNSQLFIEAESDFHQALRLNPYDGENMANLAVLYGKWSRRSSEDLRTQLAQRAHAAWLSALASNPMEPELWSRWGAAQLTLFADTSGAKESADHALSLNARCASAHALSGDIVARHAQSLEGEARRASFAQAEASYARAVELDGNKPAFKSAHEGARAAQALRTSYAPFPFALAR